MRGLALCDNPRPLCGRKICHKMPFCCENHLWCFLLPKKYLRILARPDLIGQLRSKADPQVMIICSCHRNTHTASGISLLSQVSHSCLRYFTPTSGISLLSQVSHSCLRYFTPTSGISLLPLVSHSCLRCLIPASGISLLPRVFYSYLRYLICSSGMSLLPQGVKKNF